MKIKSAASNCNSNFHTVIAVRRDVGIVFGNCFCHVIRARINLNFHAVHCRNFIHLIAVAREGS